MKLYNLARVSTATVGTGTITLGGAVAPFLTFAQAGVADGEVVSYSIIDGVANSEIGTGTYTLAGTTLTRTVTKSTNSNTAISLSGSAQVLITPRAEDLVANAHQVQDFRLTLTTGVPVTVADVTAAGTLYASPMGSGRRIALYSNSTWNLCSSAEFSLALTLTSGKPYDVFCYDSGGGTPALEVLVWTNDTTRATALSTQDGVYIKSGDATRRYMGTLYASGTNTTEDSYTKRYLWNYYHRRPRPMRRLESTNTWTYTIATYRQANASSSNQLDMIRGLDEDAVFASVVAGARNDTGGMNPIVSIGLDSATSGATGVLNGVKGFSINNTNTYDQVHAQLSTFPGVGRHYLTWIEQSSAVGVTTWMGNIGAATLYQAGIHGTVMA